MTKKDKVLIYHQRILGRMLFSFADLNSFHTKYLTKLGTAVVSKIDVKSPVLLKKQKALRHWNEQKDYIFGLFGFQLDWGLEDH